MERISSSQRVGLLAGLVLFLGSLMTAYFGNTNLWAWATLITLVFTVWAMAQLWAGKGLWFVSQSGFLFAAGAALVARVLGLFWTRITFDGWTLKPLEGYDIVNGELADSFRVMLNGSFNQTIGLIFLAGVLGAVVAGATVWLNSGTAKEGK